MQYQFNRNWMLNKFAEIQKRILLALEQLDDNQVNWRPNSNSNSIANIIIHMKGNIQERIENGICGKEVIRNRDEEFGEEIYRDNNELKKIVNEYFVILIETTRDLTTTKLEETQWVRNKERMNLEILHQCAAHFSEHLGQILYIAKQCLDEGFISTSIPKPGV